MIKSGKAKDEKELLSNYKRRIELLRHKCAQLDAKVNQLSTEKLLLVKKAKSAVIKARQDASNARHRAKRLQAKLDKIQSKEC